MNNIHTYTICHMNLIMTMVSLMHGELFEFTGDVVRCARVQVPVWISNVAGRCHSSKASISNEIFLKRVPTNVSSVTGLRAHQTTRLVLATGLILGRARMVLIVGVAAMGRV
jgi:hypothetical protein